MSLFNLKPSDFYVIRASPDGSYYWIEDRGFELLSGEPDTERRVVHDNIASYAEASRIAIRLNIKAREAFSEDLHRVLGGPPG
jgi:hypothetical protein